MFWLTVFACSCKDKINGVIRTEKPEADVYAPNNPDLVAYTVTIDVQETHTHGHKSTASSVGNLAAGDMAAIWSAGTCANVSQPSLLSTTALMDANNNALALMEKEPGIFHMLQLYLMGIYCELFLVFSLKGILETRGNSCFRKPLWG